MADVPFDPDRVIRAELHRDEKLLWVGRPRRGLVFRVGDLLLVPFSLGWLLFSLFMCGAVFEGIAQALDGRSQGGLRYMLCGLLGCLPFVAIGLYLSFGRFIVDARQRRRTAYALTDERALMVIRAPRRRILSMPLRVVPVVWLEEHRGNRGTIFFGPPWFWHLGSDGQPPRFDQISGAREVYEMVRDAQRAAGG